MESLSLQVNSRGKMWNDFSAWTNLRKLEFRSGNELELKLPPNLCKLQFMGNGIIEFSGAKNFEEIVIQGIGTPKIPEGMKFDSLVHLQLASLPNQNWTGTFLANCPNLKSLHLISAKLESSQKFEKVEKLCLHSCELSGEIARMFPSVKNLTAIGCVNFNLSSWTSSKVESLFISAADAAEVFEWIPKKTKFLCIIPNGQTDNKAGLDKILGSVPESLESLVYVGRQVFSAKDLVHLPQLPSLKVLVLLDLLLETEEDLDFIPKQLKFVSTLKIFPRALSHPFFAEKIPCKVVAEFRDVQEWTVEMGESLKKVQKKLSSIYTFKNCKIDSNFLKMVSELDYLTSLSLEECTIEVALEDWSCLPSTLQTISLLKCAGTDPQIANYLPPTCKSLRHYSMTYEAKETPDFSKSKICRIVWM